MVPFEKVLLNGILPMLIQRSVAPNRTHRLADGLVVELSTLAVTVVIHRPIRGNAQVARRLNGIDVGP